MLATAMVQINNLRFRELDGTVNIHTTQHRHR